MAEPQTKEQKYPYIARCKDGQHLFRNLGDAPLSAIEHIISAFGEKIDIYRPLIDPRLTNSYGDWTLKILDDSYQPIGFELGVLKWYEGHVKTDTMIGFMKAAYNDTTPIRSEPLERPKSMPRMSEARKNELIGNFIYWATEVINNDEEIIQVLHKSIGFTKEELEEFDVEALEGYFNKVYYHIAECDGANYFMTNLSHEGLDYLEKVLADYRLGKISLVVPRDGNDEIDFEGEWKVDVKDHDHIPTEAELDILKWYEGFEDMGYICYSIEDQVHPTNIGNIEHLSAHGMQVTDFIEALEGMWQSEDKTAILDWVRFAAFLTECDDTESTTLEFEMQDLYLPLRYVQNNFSPDILESVLENETNGNEIIYAAMMYQAGMTNGDVEQLGNEGVLMGGYIPLSDDEEGSLSVIKIAGRDDKLYLTENETPDYILSCVNRIGTLCNLTGKSVDNILSRTKLSGMRTKEITNPHLIRAIEASCAGTTAIQSLTVYNPVTTETMQANTDCMTEEDVKAFLHNSGDDGDITAQHEPIL